MSRLMFIVLTIANAVIYRAVAQARLEDSSKAILLTSALAALAVIAGSLRKGRPSKVGLTLAAGVTAAAVVFDVLLDHWILLDRQYRRAVSSAEVIEWLFTLAMPNLILWFAVLWPAGALCGVVGARLRHSILGGR